MVFHSKHPVRETNICNLDPYLFLYQLLISGHRPAQRECARTGLRSHARCHPYPIPQPVKVGHTTGVYVPQSFQTVVWVLLRPTRTDQWKCRETGPTVFRPYPRRLESQMSLQGQHFLLSYLKTLGVGPAGVWTCDLRSADWRSPNWANKAAVWRRLGAETTSIPVTFI